MPLRHVLSITDHGAAAERGVERAAELAARHGARLHLFATCAPAAQAHTHHPDRLDMRARQLALRHGIEVSARPWHALDEAMAPLGRQGGERGDSARAADGLLVLDAAWLRTWPWHARIRARGLWGGCPVWVLREGEPPPSTPSRPAPSTLLVDDGQVPIDRLWAWASRIVPRGPLERLSLPGRAVQVHVWPPPLADPGADAPWRERDHLSSRRNRVDHRRGRLDAVQLIARQAERSRAALVVLPTRPEPWWRHLLGRSLPQRLAQRIDGDVLVLPQGG